MSSWNLQLMVAILHVQPDVGCSGHSAVAEAVRSESSDTFLCSVLNLKPKLHGMTIHCQGGCVVVQCSPLCGYVRHVRTVPCVQQRNTLAVHPMAVPGRKRMPKLH